MTTSTDRTHRSRVTRLLASSALMIAVSGCGPDVERSAPNEGIVAADEAAGEREDGTGAFRTHYLETHVAFDDPLVHPGRPGAAHEHVFLEPYRGRV